MLTKNETIAPIYTKLAVAGLAAVLIGDRAAHAALDYGTADTLYTQSFDSLSATGTANPSWTNNETLPGFYAFHSGATSGATGRTTNSPDSIAVENWRAVNDYRSGGGSSSRLYAWGHGTENPTDRALGSLTGSSGTADAGDFFYALVLRNTTGQTLTSFTLSYAGEQWFDQFNTNGNVVGAHTLDFSYLVKPAFDAAADIPTQSGFGDYTRDPRLSFSSPVTGNPSTSSVVALDGNDPANRTQLSATIDVSWAPDDFLVLRFWDDDNDGNDQPHGIDDLSFVASAGSVPEVPEPGAAGLVLIAAASLGLARRRRRRRSS